MDISQYHAVGRIRNRHLLTLCDYAPEEIYEILHTARLFKQKHRAGERTTHVLAGKTLALIFAKSSTRTRVSFEMGMKQLGGDILFLPVEETQLGRGETLGDTVRVLERYGIDGIMMRTFSQDDLVQLAANGKIPVINGLTDLCHPCQILADLLTVWERFGTLSGKKIAYLGDGNNIANSLLAGCSKCGMEVAIACPEGYEPDEEFLRVAQRNSEAHVLHDPEEAVKKADVVYTDVFFSMGQDADETKRKALAPFRVDDLLMARANPEAIFLHCLPAHRGEEVTSSVLDGPRSLVLEQAENRLHAQKAVLSLLLGDRS